MASPRRTAARRPLAGGLYALKPWFVARLRRLEDRAVARGVSADQLTWLGAAAAAATAAVIVAGLRVPLLWLAVGPLCLVRMGCNALDGAVARRTRSSGRRGAVLNELVDRGADLVTFGALAPVVGAGLAGAAAVTALGTSFVAVVSQAVTGERSTMGPLGKPDRVAVLSLGAAVAAVAGPSALQVTAWGIVAMGSVTAVRRTAALWRDLGDQA